MQRKPDPKDFEDCVKSEGATFKTETLPKNRYRRICITKEGKEFRSEIKFKKL